MEEYITSSELLERAEILYTFVDTFSKYENEKKDYGTGDLLTMTEVHMVNRIYSRPGITATDLAAYTHRTKGFISQVISKMTAEGYIIRVDRKDNAKVKELYVTAKGQHLCRAHNEYDERILLKTYNYLLRDCTPEEVGHFYKVMQTYINIMNAGADKRRRKAQEKSK